MNVETVSFLSDKKNKYFTFNHEMKVLLLDSNWQPVKVISWQRAMALLVSNRAQIVEEYNDKVVRTFTKEYKVPAILRMFGHNRNNKKVNLTRLNVFYRDRCTCAYCGQRKSTSDLTLDHVLPQSKGGGRTWKNLVSACLKCNQRKANKTPEQAGMKLLFQPHEPRWSVMWVIRLTENDPIDVWSNYINGLQKI